MSLVRCACYAVVGCLAATNAAHSIEGTILLDPDPNTAPPLSVRQAIEQLADGDPQVRAAACERLDELGEAHFDVMHYPFETQEVGRLRDEAAPMIPKLIAALSSDDPRVRTSATYALASIGPKAGAALPILKRRWHAITTDAPDDSEEVMALMLALIRITPVDEPVLPVLYEGLLPSKGGEVADVEFTAADLTSISMGTFFSSRMLVNADRTVQEVPFLVQTAEGQNPIAVRLSAIGILEHFGPEARDAIPALRRLLGDENEAVRICAGGALVVVENDRRLVKEIVKSLRTSPEHEAAFLEGARLHFEQQDQMLASLRSVAQDVSSDDAVLAEEAAYFIHQYVVGINSFKGATRRQYINALRQIGPPARSAVPRLIALTRDSDAMTREYAEKALWAIDPASAAKLACEDACGRKARSRRLFPRNRFRDASHSRRRLFMFGCVP